MMYGNGSPTTPELDEPAPNLEVIYQAFGEQADLYKDVLQVKSTATAEQIQMAYFDRRSELFALLASIDSEEEQDDITASHRFHAERKMDAVVMAVRILGDPDLRQEYDNVMALRQSATTKKQPKEPPSSNVSRSSISREPDGVYAGVPHDEAPPPSPRGRKSPKRRSPRGVGAGGSSDDQEQQPQQQQPQDLQESSSNRSSSNGEDDGDQPPQLADDSSDSRFMQVVPPSPPKPKKKHHKHSKNKHSSTSAKKEKSKKKHHHQKPLPPPPPSPTVDQSIDQSTLLGTRGGPDDDDETFPDNDTMTLNDTLDGTIDEGTIASGSTFGDSRRRRLAKSGMSTLSTYTNQGFVSRIQEEVAGTVEDTLVSFEQVMNVFTLQEKDIRAVMGRIDKAKKQLKKRR